MLRFALVQVRTLEVSIQLHFELFIYWYATRTLGVDHQTCSSCFQKNLKISRNIKKSLNIIKTRWFFVSSRYFFLNGGADESRTRYPLRAKQMLSQLSYSPICRRLCIISNLFKKKRVIFIKVKNIGL